MKNRFALDVRRSWSVKWNYFAIKIVAGTI